MTWNMRLSSISHDACFDAGGDDLADDDERDLKHLDISRPLRVGMKRAEKEMMFSKTVIHDFMNRH